MFTRPLGVTAHEIDLVKSVVAIRVAHFEQATPLELVAIRLETDAAFDESHALRRADGQVDLLDPRVSSTAIRWRRDTIQCAVLVGGDEATLSSRHMLTHEP